MVRIEDDGPCVIQSDIQVNNVTFLQRASIGNTYMVTRCESWRFGPNER